MRRLALVPLVLVTMVAAACIPAPPPGWIAPKVDSIVVSPTTVVAGEPFTVTVAASDDVIVGSIQVRISPPYRLNGSVADPWPLSTCAGDPFTPAPAVTVEFTCTALPTFVPNGLWTANVSAKESGGAMYGGAKAAPFTLVGGSEDRLPPAVVSLVETPDPAKLGEPFTVTLRTSDEHPRSVPVALDLLNSVYQVPNPPPQVYQSCGTATPTPISPTISEYVWHCLVPEGAAPAWYGGVMVIYDEIGHKLSEWTHIEVVAP